MLYWTGANHGAVTLGIRVGKLGISEEAITAWKLDRKKYFIVLIHYSNYYQNLTRISGEVGGYHVKKSIDLCVGQATRYKPTLKEAITAFSKVSAAERYALIHNGVRDGLESEADREKRIKPDGDFEGIFISGPLNQLLNTNLVPLLKYRLHYGFGWDGAELYYNSEPSNSVGTETSN